VWKRLPHLSMSYLSVPLLLLLNDSAIMQNLWRQMYHVNVERLTLLDKGDGAPWTFSQPPFCWIIDTSKRARDPAVDSAFDDLPRPKMLILLRNLLLLPHASPNNLSLIHCLLMYIVL
jgi:hypothetical protein